MSRDVKVDTSRRDNTYKESENYQTFQDCLKEHGFNTERISNHTNPYVAITPSKLFAFRNVAKTWGVDNPHGFAGKTLIIITNEKWNKYLSELRKACAQYTKATKTKVIIEVLA